MMVSSLLNLKKISKLNWRVKMKKIISLLLIVLLLISMFGCIATKYTLLDRVPVSLHIPKDAEIIDNVVKTGVEFSIAIKPFMARNIDISPLIKSILREYPQADGIGNLEILSKWSIWELIFFFPTAGLITWIVEGYGVKGILFSMPENSTITKSSFDYSIELMSNGEELKSLKIRGYILREDFEEALEEKFGNDE